ncbi:hypothetical protein CH275_16390 [Rhodococcus sp. 06-235-1A]|uniref:hypothetical protein n=1 Tax=Rhodococcus sp. 06-235-1A TaxID=2022508 RepID=UPI000B9B382F|nr:hypothetical protein [Rhodococcus sp. 06-235-1A]OZD03359.1 hypothetical protein CH275_16390 [Rhodococcus sp. 06-235-1A]
MASLSDRSPGTSRPGSKPWERAALTDTPSTPHPRTPAAAPRPATAAPPVLTSREAAVAGLSPKPVPKPVPRPIPQNKRGRRSRLAIWGSLAAASLVAGAAIGAVTLALSDDSANDASFAAGMSSMLTTPAAPATTTAAPSPTTTPALASPPPCVESRTGGVVTGAGPGGFGSGPDAILGFDYAYYVTRSGAAARAFTTPDAAVGSPELLQSAGIDTFPSETTHCLRITPRGPDEYTVYLTHAVPGAEPVTWTQIVRTRTDGDRTLITSIVDITETEN